MTHTAELHTELTRQEYFYLMGSPDRKPERDKETGATSYHIRTLEQYGITDIYPRKAITRSEYTYYYCVIIINLQRITNNGQKTIETYDNEDDFTALSRNFSKYISLVLPAHSCLNGWSVQRIDYNIDLKMQYENVEKYITLLQRGGKAYSWKVHELFEDKSKRKKSKHGQRKTTHPKGSILFENKQYNVNIYDKYRERLASQQERGIIDERELQESKGVLRIEIQAKKNKVRTLKSKYEIAEKTVENYARYDIAEPLIMQVLKDIAGETDYYSMERAINKITQSNIKGTTKDDIVGFLRLVNNNRSLWKAKKKYNGKTKLETVLKRLDKLNINPVTLPRSFGSDEMPNLFHIVGAKIAEKRFKLQT